MVNRTIPYKSYISPKREYTKEVALALGLETPYSYSIVKDIANYLSYPEDKREDCFTAPSSWRIEDEQVDIDNGVSEEALEEKIEAKKTYHKNIQNFIRELDFSKIKGETPLQQALSVVAALNASISSPKASPTDSEDEDVRMPQFSKEGAAGAIAQQVEDTLEVTDTIVPGSFTEKALGGGKSPLAGIRASHIGKKHIDILKKIAVFNAKGAIKAQKKQTKKIVDVSDFKKVLSITQHSDVAKVSVMQYAMPDFKYKHASLQLTKNTCLLVEESRQVLVLLIDDSGSMNRTEKVGWLKALLINRCEEVIAGNAELYIATFEVELDEHWLAVRNREEAEDIWDKFQTYFELGRGGTDIQKAVTQAIDIIESKLIPTKTGIVQIKGHRPQICVINDGQDAISKNWIPKIVTHGFILDGSNAQMKKACERSGGIYEEFYN